MAEWLKALVDKPKGSNAEMDRTQDFGTCRAAPMAPQAPQAAGRRHSTARPSTARRSAGC